MTRRILLLVGVAGAALLTAVAHKQSSAPGWPDNGDAQRLKFSHALHVKDNGMACLDCHAAAKTSTSSGDVLRPNHEVCSTCHSEQVTSTCTYCHLNPDHIEAAPAPVREISFNHAKHVAMAGVECATCHQGLGEATLAGPQNMPSMATCTSCHNDRTATSACEQCHTNFATLIPADHLVGDFTRDHKKLTRLGALDVTCSTCHTQSFCADCHDASTLVQIGKGGLMADPSPRVPLRDSPKQMALQAVHPMNYKFTHGIDAKSKTVDCYSCHSQENFCSECHASGGGVTGEILPSWHTGAGFTTLGVGSGGGLHAQMAKRDIESCASCHDAQGGDPVCITCHMDPDGIQHTDPKTHPDGYMHNEHGSWHSNGGAVCYNCHTDMNAHPGGQRGRGFCGYCHN